MSVPHKDFLISYTSADPQRFPGAFPPIWSIPYSRNAIFTGRDELLTQLADTLVAGQATALPPVQTLSGPGGVGRTQIAVEYAYRYRHKYRAVFWVLSATRESLVAGYLTLAELLNLPEKDAEVQQVVIEAVKAWLQSEQGWLLILDDADDPVLVREFVPPVLGGHLLLTTRAQSMEQLASRIEVETMDLDTGVVFLLRRASLIEPRATLADIPSADKAVAREICEALGGLPLALDQAGAYLEETQCSLADYHQRYWKQQAKLLERRGIQATEHPEPFAVTCSLSFQTIEQKHPAATDLLRFCAFVHPDTIPEELIVAGAKHLGERLQRVETDPLLLNEMIKVLKAYAFLDWNAEQKTLSLHRVVQTIVRDAMDEQTRHLWVERTVQAVNEVFPRVSFTTWSQCEWYLPHALVCAELVERCRIRGPEASRLLYHAGCYLIERARFREAYPLLQQALVINEHHLYQTHPQRARPFQVQGKRSEAKPLGERALEVQKRPLRAKYLNVAASLNNLAWLYDNQGKYEQAEPLYRRALGIREQQLGADHPDTAHSLHGLAALAQHQWKYKQAESLYLRVLSIYEQQLEPEHPFTAQSLNNLASLYHEQGRYTEAKALFQRALSIREQALGPEHVDTAQSAWWLAVTYWRQHQFDQAELLYQRAFSVYERMLGSEHPRTQNLRKQYVLLLSTMGHDAEASALKTKGYLPS
jgi:tetratricopeptide (TPR) repeat protein